MKVKTCQKSTKIRDLIWSIANNLDVYDEKCIKIKVNSDDNLFTSKENVRAS